MRAFLSRLLKFGFFRFLVSGVFNTALTYVVYLLLLMVIPYQLSYTISYVLGIVLAFWLNRSFVFKSHRGIRSLLFFPFVYLFQYLIGMLMLWVWVERLGLNQELAPIAAVVITVPLTYVLSRLVFVQRQSF